MMDYSILPVGEHKKALDTPHFPARFLAVIWRNWGLIPFDRLARVLRTTEDKIREAGSWMGLSSDEKFDFPLWNKRGYLSIIRKNWHLLDYPQLCELLDFDTEKLAFILREDDFFWCKLGLLKPEAGEVFYHPLTLEQQKKVRAIGRQVRRIKKTLPQKAEKPFAFLDQFGRNLPEAVRQSDDSLRLIYSYSALYGDPLLDESLDPFPENLLAEYAANGVNAVWLQGILYTLVPWLGEELAIHHQKRIASLRNLIAKADRYGIKIYLYLNEPRGIPPRYFRNFPEWGGSISNEGIQAFCTESPEMLAALSNAVKTLCEKVPGLGGFFTITQSENLTHCLSRPRESLESLCPRCGKSKTPAQSIVRVLKAIHQGIQSAGTGAKLTAWSWAWLPEYDEEILRELPADIQIQCVSETDVETDCMGIKGKILDYSISHPGPGPVAQRLWAKARRHHHKAIAKIQINTTWENCALPYIPTPQLIKRHLDGIRKEGVNDFMLSWTLGGFPGGNIELLQLSVEELAVKKFGRELAPRIVAVWQHFSDGFSLFPFNYIDMIYLGPQSVGPANLFYNRPSGYRASMVGYPYDDLAGWSGAGHYPGDVLEKTFEEMSLKIGKGLNLLRRLASHVPAQFQDNYHDLLSVSEAFYCNIRSSYLQISYIRLNYQNKARMLEIFSEEARLTKRLLLAQRGDSRIGFEATNQYMYVENDLIEKLLNLQNLKEELV